MLWGWLASNDREKRPHMSDHTCDRSGSIVRKNQQCLVDQVVGHQQLDTAHPAAHIDADSHNH